MADWEPWLPAPAQYHWRGLYCTLIASQRTNSKSEVLFLLNEYCFHTILQIKNCRWNPLKSWIVYTIDFYIKTLYSAMLMNTRALIISLWNLFSTFTNDLPLMKIVFISIQSIFHIFLFSYSICSFF